MTAFDRRRALVLAAAALAVLLVGGAAGMLITLARVDQNAPDANSIDVGFAQDMRVHHLQAITMAGVERDRTTDPQLHSLAFDIESTQLTQAGMMSGWLTAWGQPELRAPGEGYMAWMSAGSHFHGSAATPSGGVTQMPGMATTQELNKLKSLSGTDLDVYFLQLMLRHHQGGLAMAQYAADHAGVGYVRNLASKIVSGQTAEVQLMTSLLNDRHAQPLPAPS